MMYGSFTCLKELKILHRLLSESNFSVAFWSELSVFTKYEG